MDNLFMFDAFKALDSLNEDTFKVDDEGIEELSEFEKMDNIDDSVDIIDMHADDEEELEDSYIGKVILACNVCDSKVFEDKDKVVIDEETPDSANTDMECPYCHTVDGFKIIGEIGEFHKHDDDDDDKAEDEEEEIEDKEEEEIEVEDEEESENLEESKHKKFTDEDDIDAEMDDEKEAAKKRWERRKNDARSKRDYRIKHDLKEGLEDGGTPKKRTRKKKPLFDSLFDEIYVQLAKTPYSPASYFHKGVYSDISSTDDGRDIQLGAPSRTDEYINGYDTIRIQYNANEESHIPFDFAKKLADKYGLTYRTSPDGVYLYIDIPENAPALNKPVVYRGEFIEREDLEEDFKEASITTDTEKMEMFSDENGKVTITTEPINSIEEEVVEDEEEVIAPISDETKAEIESDSEAEEPEEEVSEEDTEAEETKEESEDEIDVDFDDIDEESFDELAESYLKTIYSNVESYKTTNASATKDKFMLEGLITFASGAVKNTNFVFAPKAATKAGKLQFIGENLQITRNRNAFKFNASIANKKLLGESLTYNYSTKDSAGKMRKLYGTIKRK